MHQHIIFQKVESAILFVVSTVVYFHAGYSLLTYLLLLFVFDIFMIGYLKNVKVGAILYNLGHSLSVPLVVLLVSWLAVSAAGIGFCLIWCAHIGLDRALGYGLKLNAGFKKTHLGNIGNSKV